MDARLIWWPAVAMVALTCAVWLRLYFVRIVEMKRERIDPQSIATSATAAARLRDTRASDNFRNLFELPVLFYAAVIVAANTAQVTALTLGLAWSFAVLRIVHSAIHCTYNRVMHRFSTYMSGALVLWALWIVLALGLLQ
jgi:hypothetical protein